MFHRSAAVVSLATLFCVGATDRVTSAAAKSDAASITGVAKGSDRRPFADCVVRLRSLDTGRVVATTRTNAAGD
jgi:hypothetical protein